MGLLSNRIDKKSLKPGDHIYSWRTAYIYAHHGIYVGNDMVIHFTRGGQEVGTGTVLDLLLVCSAPAISQVPCPICTPSEEGSGVVSSCLDCFLGGGILYRFEYSVSPALFIASRGGTCTRAVSDPDDLVVYRAEYLLEYGFGCYDVFKNNCEDFAIYCKTGILVLGNGSIGQSGQAIACVGGPLAALLSTTPLRIVTTNFYVKTATAIGSYCMSRYAADIAMRMDTVKIPVEDLSRRPATALLQVIEPQLSADPAH